MLDPTLLPESLSWLQPIQHTQATYEDLEHDLRRVIDVLDSLVLPRQKRAKAGRPAEEEVYQWASRNGVGDAIRMGAPSWEQCLFDLGYEGGKNHRR